MTTTTNETALRAVDAYLRDGSDATERAVALVLALGGDPRDLPPVVRNGRREEMASWLAPVVADAANLGETPEELTPYL